MQNKESKISSIIDNIKEHSVAIDIITSVEPAYSYYLNPERGPKSKPSIIFKPHNVDTLHKLILLLNQFKLPAVLFAGNTGLVSAQTANDDAVIDLNFLNNIISLELESGLRLNFTKPDENLSHVRKAEIWQSDVLAFIASHNLEQSDLKNATLTCEAGASTGSINSILELAGLELPIDTGAVYFGAGMSAGAGVANASHGTYGLLYGKMSDLAIEVHSINGDGSFRTDLNNAYSKPVIDENRTIIDSARAQYGDSAIGTQGTFAVVTLVKFRTAIIPHQQHYFLVKANSIAQINELRRELHSKFPDNLRQFELMDTNSTEFVRLYEPDNFVNPFEADKPYDTPYVLMLEFISDSIYNMAEEVYNELSAKVSEADIAYSGLMADDVIGDFESFKKLRHSISGASTKHAVKIGLTNSTEGSNLSVQHRITPDVSVPLKNLEAFIDELQTTFKAPENELCIFGHIGIGAMHVHIFTNTHTKLLDIENGETKKQLLTKKVFEIVKKYDGSCWSEHGIGTANAKLYTQFTAPEYVSEWLSYKKQHDPNNILNPNSNNFSELIK